ncbi:MAG: hypothetical protein BGO51_03280 [Rhodospirillales bacterium 69-11]|nr:MAG: hypothetical protein BGO51_03280 [Rhodospirillales bacterium 69-11]
MLFTDPIFLFGFLPAALAGFFGAARLGQSWACAWLVIASLVFYGWFEPRFVPLLLGSLLLNHGVARLLEATRERRLQRVVLWAGIGINLAALAYCKYLAWLISLLDDWVGLGVAPPSIALPLGISFFTFTQIGYLLDVRDGEPHDRSAVRYAVFVTFFPHLIAGPILHHREIMPQFADPATYRFAPGNLALGASIFIVGLLKKTVLADPTATGVAEAFAHPEALPLFAAWNATLSYSLQLYFDFSGYSDMAIGLARMANVRFPLNFDSPYKAQSVIAYWQRWHMTLTRYLTRYLHDPLTLWAMRRRRARRLPVDRAAQVTLRGFGSMILVPVFVTIGLAGIWHGSGAQFLVFGLLHATWLTIARLWGLFRPARAEPGPFGRLWRVALTYLCVLVAAVFFRAPSVDAALAMLAGLSGLHGIGPALPLPASWLDAPAALPLPASWAEGAGALLHGIARPAEWHEGSAVMRQVLWLAALYAIVWGLPNTQQIFVRFDPALDTVRPGGPAWLRWRPTAPWALAVGALGMVALLSLGGTREFLYFQF